MVTILDISLLSGAKAIFAFLLIFCLVYGLFKYTKFLNLSDGMIAIVSVALAFLAILSPQFVRVIEIVTPWYMVLFFSIVLIMVVIMIFGSLGSDFETIKKNMGNNYRSVVIWIIVISLIIMVSGVSQVFLGGDESEFSINSGGQRVVSDSSEVSGDVDGKGSSAFIDALFHPKVLGLMAILLIATFSVYLLGGSKL